MYTNLLKDLTIYRKQLSDLKNFLTHELIILQVFSSCFCIRHGGIKEVTQHTILSITFKKRNKFKKVQTTQYFEYNYYTR
jgi:hypothetical protein